MERVNIDTKRTGILDYNYNNVYYEVGIISKGVASSDPCPSRKKNVNKLYLHYIHRCIFCEVCENCNRIQMLLRTPLNSSVSGIDIIQAEIFKLALQAGDFYN